jgi:hypothetical protein
MNIVPLFPQEVFGPCEIRAMSIALDEVCGKLGLTEDKDEERAVLAKCIVALARNGERDPAVLRDGVLREVAVSAWRGISYSHGTDDRLSAGPAPDSRARGRQDEGPSLRERGA